MCAHTIIFSIYWQELHCLSLHSYINQMLNIWGKAEDYPCLTNTAMHEQSIGQKCPILWRPHLWDFSSHLWFLLWLFWEKEAALTRCLCERPCRLRPWLINYVLYMDRYTYGICRYITPGPRWYINEGHVLIYEWTILVTAISAASIMATNMDHPSPQITLNSQVQILTKFRLFRSMKRHGPQYKTGFARLYKIVHQ